MTKALQFLAIVQDAVKKREQPFGDYMRIAAKTSLKIPDDVTAEEAAGAFLRALYGDPPEEGSKTLQDSI